MNDSILRNNIRCIISEFMNSAWVYAYGPNKFPKLDGSNKTPSELDVEFDSDYNFYNDELEEIENNTDLEASQKKNIIPNKH